MKHAIFPLYQAKLPFALDLLERAIAAAFFSFFALRILNAYIETGMEAISCCCFQNVLSSPFFF
jgi:hypothetical protein